MQIQPVLYGAIVSGFLILSAICPAPMGSLRAGVAKVDVSPAKEMRPIKNNRVFGSVHDPVQWSICQENAARHDFGDSIGMEEPLLEVQANPDRRSGEIARTPA